MPVTLLTNQSSVSIACVQHNLGNCHSVRVCIKYDRTARERRQIHSALAKALDASLMFPLKSFWTSWLLTFIISAQMSYACLWNTADASAERLNKLCSIFMSLSTYFGADATELICFLGLNHTRERFIDSSMSDYSSHCLITDEAKPGDVGHMNWQLLHPGMSFLWCRSQINSQTTQTTKL